MNRLTLCIFTALGLSSTAHALTVTPVPQAPASSANSFAMSPDNAWIVGIMGNGRASILDAPYNYMYTSYYAGFAWSETREINANASAVGRGYINGVGTRPFVWSNVFSQPTVLAIPAGGTDGRAMAINDAGVVAGDARTGSTNSILRWTPWGSGYQMSVILTNPTALLEDINSRGTLVGDGYQYSTWSQGWMVKSNGSLSRIQPPSANSWSPVQIEDVNNYDEVVGYTAAIYNPVVYDQAFMRLGSGAYVDLSAVVKTAVGASAAANTRANAINDNRYVVGTYATTNYSVSRGFVFDYGGQQVYDLTRMAPTGWVIERALDIDERGRVLATGRYNGGAQQTVILDDPNFAFGWSKI